MTFIIEKKSRFVSPRAICKLYYIIFGLMALPKHSAVTDSDSLLPQYILFDLPVQSQQHGMSNKIDFRARSTERLSPFPRDHI